MLKEKDEMGNLDFYKYRNNRNGTYLRNEKREKRALLLNTLKYMWLFKANIIILSSGIFNICQCNKQDK